MTNLTENQRARLAKHGLIAKYRPSECDAEDAEFVLQTLAGEPTPYTIQIGGCYETAGYYFPNMYFRDADGEITAMLPLGEYRSIGQAIERLLLVVRADKEVAQ